MFIKTGILIALAVASIYPLYFWSHFPQPFKTPFRKFHIALPNIIGGAVLIAVWVLDIPLNLKLLVSLWKVALISASSYSWRNEDVDLRIMTVPCVLGGYVFRDLYESFAQPPWRIILVGILLSLVVCVLVFFRKYQTHLEK
jgi:hypothetical protein